MASPPPFTFRLDEDRFRRELESRLNGDERRIRRATEYALNWTAAEVKKDVRADMPRVFDRPTPYALNSLYVRRANRNQQTGATPLTAIVWFKDDFGKGTPASRYLFPQIFGGTRADKRAEILFKNAGVMPRNKQMMPGQFANLDPYGNLRRGDIVLMLSDLQASGQTGYLANRTARSTRRATRFFFVGTPGGGPLGIYERVGPRPPRRRGQAPAMPKGFQNIVRFISPPDYRPRLDFYGIAQNTTNRVFPRKLDDAIQLVLT